MTASYREKKQREYRSRLNKALHYIDKHIDRELSLEVISRAAGFSPYHFHRIFRSIVGETLSDYVRRIRLEKAAIVLVHNPFRSITEVALDCGFSSSSYFARAFKEHFGMSASKWREGGSYEQRLRKIRQSDRKDVEDSEPSSGYNSRVGNKTTKEHEMRVEVRYMAELHIAYIRHLNGYWDPGLAETALRLYKWANTRDLLKPDTKYLGISHDDPDVTPRDKCRYDVCVTVPKEIKPEGEVNTTILPQGKYAIYHFEGQPQEIKEAYDYIYGKWLPESGYQPADSPCYEIFLNNPQEDPEGTYIFDMCIPVKPL